MTSSSPALLAGAAVNPVQLPKLAMESRLDQPSAADCRDATEGDAEPVEEPVIWGKRRAIPAEVPVDKEMKLSGRLEGGAGL
jgi:hypothetical protein